MNRVGEGTGMAVGSKTHYHFRDYVNLKGVGKSRHLFAVDFFRSKEDADKILNYNDGCIFPADTNYGSLKFSRANKDNLSHQWIFAKPKERKAIENRIGIDAKIARLNKKRDVELANMRQNYQSSLDRKKENYDSEIERLRKENEEKMSQLAKQMEALKVDYRELKRQNKGQQSRLAQQQQEILNQGYRNVDAQVQQLQGALQEKDRYWVSQLQEKEKKIADISAKLEASSIKEDDYKEV